MQFSSSKQDASRLECHLLHRLAALAIFLFVLTAAEPVLCKAPANESDTRPNILLIMADDMGYECLTANGGESYRTPRLDQLAAGGIRFEHCHAQPICTPTRVQLMTGIYNNRNYIRFGILDPEAQTFGHLFRDAGYRTVIAGKWQLKGGFSGPNHFGFDEYCLWQLTRLPPRYPNPGFEINGRAVNFTGGKYGPDIAADYLCDFFEKNRDQPFFAYYPMLLPHFPFQPTPDSEEWNPQESREYRKKEWRDKWFADMVAYTDKVVGRLIDKLESLQLREKTLVIFTGDNGTYAGMKSRFNGAEYIGGKGSPQDNGTHVPLIVNWPGKTPSGKVSQSLVDLSDMLPTIAEVAGIEVPSRWDIDGQSFATEVYGKAPAKREWIYCWYHRDGVRSKASQHVRNQQFKLYASGKYFDVVADPQESRPLSIAGLSAEDRKVYDKLQQALAKHVKVTRQSNPIINKKRKLLQPAKKKKQ